MAAIQPEQQPLPMIKIPHQIEVEIIREFRSVENFER